MAKRNTQTRTRESNGGASKAEAVRQFEAPHPDAGAKEIGQALTEQGVEVTAGRVSAVLRDQLLRRGAPRR